MDKFNQGWWNCFLSYTDTINFRSDGQDLAFEQMSSAGVNIKEINHILTNKFTMNEITKSILVAYKKLKLKERNENEH